MYRGMALQYVIFLKTVRFWCKMCIEPVKVKIFYNYEDS